MQVRLHIPIVLNRFSLPPQPPYMKRTQRPVEASYPHDSMRDPQVPGAIGSLQISLLPEIEVKLHKMSTRVVL